MCLDLNVKRDFCSASGIERFPEHSCLSFADHTNSPTPVLFFKENPVQYNLRDILRGTLPLMLVHNKNDNYISH